MKKRGIFFALLMLCLLFGACTPAETGRSSAADEGSSSESVSSAAESSAAPQSVAPAPQEARHDALPFEDGQQFAIAFLGYGSPEDLGYFAGLYLDNDDLPVYTTSEGEFYLVIPRGAAVQLTISRADINTAETVPVAEEPACGAFILQCNQSDIFPDAAVTLSAEGFSVEFTPFLSLKDGSLQAGEAALVLTK